MEYFIYLATLISIYALLAIGLNLVVGYTGLLSVAHAAFYGIGAYTTAILATRWGLTFPISLLAGLLITAAMSVSVGLILSRFRNDYYALASLSFNVIIFGAFLNLQNLTNGPLGISGIPRPVILGIPFSTSTSFLTLTFLFLGLGYLIARAIVQSSFGRVLKAIREDESAIQVFGYRTHHYKLAIFVVGALFASLAGSLYASYISYVDPNSFTINESIFMLAIIILGGLASLRGSLLGALVLILLPEVLRFLGFPSEIAGQMRQILYGLFLILLMLYRPQGLSGEYQL